MQTKAEFLTTKEMTINPALAEEWLGRNTDNRDVSPKHVTGLANEMANGAWKMNGVPIVFGASGRLLDGQHRLLACVKADCAFTSLVVFGADDSAFDTIDVGKKRNAGDMLTILHETNCTRLARALTLIWKWENGVLGSSQKVNPRQQLVLLGRSPSIRDSVAFAMAADGVLAAGIVAFLHYAGSFTDKAKTEEFLLSLHSGINLGPCAPALTLRNMLANRLKTNRKQSSGTDALVSAAIHALNAHFDGRELKQVKIRRKGDPFPKLLTREQLVRRASNLVPPRAEEQAAAYM